MNIDTQLRPGQLRSSVDQVFDLAASKTRQLDQSWDIRKGTPVVTVRGRYTTRGWTEWTQGFQYGSLILAGEGTGDDELVALGRERTVDRMLPHVTHIGVHDHGFNNLSTYGNLRRMMNEGRIAEDRWQRQTYENAIAVSGAVQAMRWSPTQDGLGYLYSFNGPHSLFIDTMRTTRILGLSYRLGHVLMGENDRPISLLGRSIEHGLTTARHIIFAGESTHGYDVRGRTAHEGTFNCNDGNFRARSTQQGYSPFSTWTRGLAWAMLGYAEELEFLSELSAREFSQATERSKSDVLEVYRRAAIDTCDHYLDDVAAADGIPYWDDGAPQLHRLGDWRGADADPFNDDEPVDASAAAIAAQGLLRLGKHLGSRKGRRYTQAGLCIARRLFAAPYLSTETEHQGLLLHSIYHWPNRWDFVPKGSQIAYGESSQWGDYHLLELALLVQRLADDGPYPTFFS